MIILSFVFTIVLIGSIPVKADPWSRNDNMEYVGSIPSPWHVDVFNFTKPQINIVTGKIVLLEKSNDSLKITLEGGKTIELTSFTTNKLLAYGSIVKMTSYETDSICRIIQVTDNKGFFEENHSWQIEVDKLFDGQKTSTWWKNHDGYFFTNEKTGSGYAFASIDFSKRCHDYVSWNIQEISK